MNKFTTYTGYAVPLAQQNIDTDAIIPKQFLQKVTRDGFGENLFHNWRYLDQEGTLINPDFVLNRAEFSEASILVTGENFGCGSSREHAPWALLDYGFKVIIASSFADIFYTNAFNNQLLLITLPEKEVQAILNTITQAPKTALYIDLVAQQVVINEHGYPFQLDDFKRHCLMNGLDAISLTLQYEPEISAYEQRIPRFYLE